MTLGQPAPRSSMGKPPAGFVDNARTRRLHRQTTPSLTSFTRVSHRFDVGPPFHDLHLGIPRRAESPQSRDPEAAAAKRPSDRSALLDGKILERDLAADRPIVGPATTGCWSGSCGRSGRCTGGLAAPTFAGRIGRSVRSSTDLAKRSPSGRLSLRECSRTGTLTRVQGGDSRGPERPALQPGRRRRAPPGPDSGPARRGSGRAGRADWPG